MLINRKQWKENQYPEEWSFKDESETVSKNFGANLLPTKTDTRATDDKREVKPPMLMLQYRGKLLHILLHKLLHIMKNKKFKSTRKDPAKKCHQRSTQGPILVPLLFLLFMIDLAERMKKISCCRYENDFKAKIRN